MNGARYMVRGLGYLRSLSDLENVPGLFEVMNLHDAKVIGLDGSLQGSRSFTHGFVCGYFDQHVFTSCLTVHFTGVVVNVRLFRG